MATEHLFLAGPAGKMAPCLHCGVLSLRYPSQTRRGRGQFCSRKCKDAYGLVEVRCAWPECQQIMPARIFTRTGRRAGPEWKTDLCRAGHYVRWPICKHHHNLAEKYLPVGHRIQNGRLKWFVDPGADLGTRSTSSIVTKLLIWSKADGLCASCEAPLRFDESPRTWHLDHSIPVFRGGKTTYWNLQALCPVCHKKKSSLEKAEASRTRHREHKSRRWLTHPEKDALILDLRREIDSLRSALQQHKDVAHAEENQR